MKAWISSAAWLCVSFCAVHAQEYDVLFHRNAVVGDKYLSEIKFTTDDEQQFSVNGAALASNKHVKVEVELAVLVENVAVDKNGYPTEEKVNVKTCRCTRDGSPVDLFKTGDEIIIKNGTPRQLTVNGKAAEGLQHTTLEQIFTSGGDDPDNNERAIGPGHKVKVGDSWPVNSEAAAASLSKKMTSPVSKEAVHGTVKLESANPKNGVPCLQLSAEITIDAGGRTLPGAPPEIIAKKFSSTFAISGDFPLDSQRQPLSERFKMISDVEGGGTTEKDGRKSEIVFKLARIQTKEAVISPAP